MCARICDGRRACGFGLRLDIHPVVYIMASMKSSVTPEQALATIAQEAKTYAEEADRVASRYASHCAGKEAANRKRTTYSNVWHGAARTGEVAFALNLQPDEMLRRLQATIEVQASGPGVSDSRSLVRAAAGSIVIKLRRWAQLLVAAGVTA